ncbi:phage portal protein, partial [Klebsiella pneumoniae]|uniref:phage portal protein n=1 Tax=Klebsiella pneumoniae TaxID=573 RepID=UPI003974C4B4
LPITRTVRNAGQPCRPVARLCITLPSDRRVQKNLTTTYSNSTYSNFSEASRAFLTMTMRPWLANFEQQIKSALLVASPVPGIRYQVEFDSADLLRATPTERYATYERGIKNGIMNPNEAREREGMPPREGGDEYSQAWKQEVKVSTGSENKEDAS